MSTDFIALPPTPQPPIAKKQDIRPANDRENRAVSKKDDMDKKENAGAVEGREDDKKENKVATKKDFLETIMAFLAGQNADAKIDIKPIVKEVNSEEAPIDELFLEEGEFDLDKLTDAALQQLPQLLSLVQAQLPQTDDKKTLEDMLAELNAAMQTNGMEDLDLAALVKEDTATGDKLAEILVQAEPGKMSEFADMLAKQIASADDAVPMPDVIKQAINDWHTKVKEEQVVKIENPGDVKTPLPVAVAQPGPQRPDDMVRDGKANPLLAARDASDGRPVSNASSSNENASNNNLNKVAGVLENGLKFVNASAQGGSADSNLSQSFEQNNPMFAANNVNAKAPAGFDAYLQNAKAAAPHTAVMQAQVVLEKMAANRQNQTMTINLQPEELGAIEIKVSFEKGKMKAHIVAEKADTLLLLQRDQFVLESALKNTGLQAEQGALSFDLREQFNAQNFEQQSRKNNHAQRDTGTDIASVNTIAIMPQHYGDDGRLDVRL